MGGRNDRQSDGELDLRPSLLDLQDVFIVEQDRLLLLEPRFHGDVVEPDRATRRRGAEEQERNQLLHHFFSTVVSYFTPFGMSEG